MKKQQTVTSCLHTVGKITPKNFLLSPVELSEMKNTTVLPVCTLTYTGTNGVEGTYFSQETQRWLKHTTV